MSGWNARQPLGHELIEETDPVLAAEIERAHRALRHGLKNMRMALKVPRKKFAPMVGMSDPGLQGVEYGKVGLSASMLIKMTRALGLPDYMRDPVIALFLPGLAKFASGRWPYEIPSGLKVYVDRHPDSHVIIKTPEMDILYSNPANDVTTPWMKAAPPGSERPTNMLLETIFNPLAVKYLVNRDELIHKMVFLFRARGEGLADQRRYREIIAEGEKHPDWERWFTTICSLEVMERNVVLIKDPDTGEVGVYESQARSGMWPYADDGHLIATVRVDRPSEPARAVNQSVGGPAED